MKPQFIILAFLICSPIYLQIADPDMALIKIQKALTQEGLK
jgi:hypothetical protein